jgi:hypothetical protein
VRPLLAVAAAGLILATEARAAGGPEPWSSLGGLWQEPGPEACDATPGRVPAFSLHVRGNRISLGTATSAATGLVSGWRAITPVRWYLDISTADDLVPLDVVKVADDRLLVAKRPLGEARWLVRCRPE